MANLYRHFIHTSLLCSTTLLAAVHTAHAQSSDSATINALATLEITQSELEIDVISPLDLGTVRIPNGSQVGNICRYWLSMEQTNGVYRQRELDSSGNTVVGSPTPSGCQSDLSAWRFAEVEVSCDPGALVTYDSTYQNAGVPGVTFGLPASGQGSAMLRLQDGSLAGSADADGDVSWQCPSDGSASLRFGGRIDLGANAQAGVQTVGTISLEASY